jgi:hypothetical protein
LYSLNNREGKEKKKNQIEMKYTSAWGISIPFDIVVNKLVGSSFLLFCLRFVIFFSLFSHSINFFKARIQISKKKVVGLRHTCHPPKKEK